MCAVYVIILIANKIDQITFFTELLEFYMNNTEVEEITLSKFHTEKNIIQNLDLIPFPAKIKSSDIPLVQTSVLKVLFF